MIIDHQPAPDGKHPCPSCREPVRVLPDGWLAHHRHMPGCGEPCPPFDTKERLS